MLQVPVIGMLLAIHPIHPAHSDDPPMVEWPPNILLIVVDDLGVDNLELYGLGVSGDYPATPAIDELAAQGVRFRNVYANPLCSPTRSTILTGRYAFRNTVGSLVAPTASEWPNLPLCEVTLPEILDGAESGFAHAAVGKWHLSNRSESAGLHPLSSHPERFGPTDAGFGRFAGSLGNIDDYYAWERIFDSGGGNPVATAITQYATAICVADALAFIDTVDDQPWFLYMALQAVHEPIQVPPAGWTPSDPTIQSDLGSQCIWPSTGCTGTLDQDDRRRIFKAMVEATDHAIGRMRSELIQRGEWDRTVVIVVGDNGSFVLPTSPPPPAALPLRSGKRSFFEGGVRVPLIISGAFVLGNPPQGRVVDDLVNTTDLFATVVELATGLDAADLLPSTTLDSISLVPYLIGDTPEVPRTHAFAELFHHCTFAQLQSSCELEPSVLPKAHRDGFALRMGDYKYIHHNAHRIGCACPSDCSTGTLLPAEDFFYDLATDPGETVDLWNDQGYQQQIDALVDFAGRLREAPASCACP